MGTQPKPKTSRREFTRTLALASVAPLAAASRLAEEPKSNPLVENAESLMRLVHAQFGKFLTEEQQKEVAKAVVRQQYIAAALRRVKLQNSDEPSFAFRADLP